MQPIYSGGQLLHAEMLATQVPPYCAAIWSLGQAGIVIKGPKDTGVICIDPYLTFAIEETKPGTEFIREFEPPLSPEHLGWVNGVLVTHHHDDHLDPFTLGPLLASSLDAVVAVPAPHRSLLHSLELEANRVVLARSEAAFSIKGFHITPVPVAHTEYEVDDQGDHVYLGYLIEVAGIRLFHAGDTVVTAELVERVRAFHPDIVMLPINGRDFERTERGIVGCMTGREAADFAHRVKADLFLPIHYDMFPNNRDNPAGVVDYLFQTYRAQKFHMLIPGERFIYMK